MRTLLVLAICLAAVCQIQPLRAQEGQIEKWAQEYFGREKLNPLDRLNAEELQKQADAIASDMRLINSYLALVRAFKSSSAVQELRPQFDASVSRVSGAFAKTMEMVQPTGILGEVPKFQNELPRLMTNPTLAAEYLVWEAEVVAPYGISPGRALASVRMERLLKFDEVSKAREVAVSLGEKVKSMSGEEVTKRVDGLAQVLTGLGIGVADWGKLRRSPVKTVFSFGAALNEIVEGGSKLFG
jgi:hypothetical protein